MDGIGRVWNPPLREFVVSCAGGGGITPFGGGEGFGGNEGGPQQLPAGNNATGGGSGGSEGSSGDSSPTASIPIFENNTLVVSNNGVVQAEGLEPNSSVMIAASSDVSVIRQEQSTFWGALKININSITRHYFFISDVQADTQCFIDDSSIATVVTDENGNLPATMVPNFSGQDVEVAYFDPVTCEVGEKVKETPMAHLVYVKGAPSGTAAVTSSGNKLYLVKADGKIVRLTYDVANGTLIPDGGFD